MVKKFCTQCGTAVVVGKRFCTHCGRVVADLDAPSNYGSEAASPSQTLRDCDADLTNPSTPSTEPPPHTDVPPSPSATLNPSTKCTKHRSIAGSGIVGAEPALADAPSQTTMDSVETQAVPPNAEASNRAVSLDLSSGSSLAMTMGGANLNSQFSAPDAVVKSNVPARALEPASSSEEGESNTDGTNLTPFSIEQPATPGTGETGIPWLIIGSIAALLLIIVGGIVYANRRTDSPSNMASAQQQQSSPTGSLPPASAPAAPMEQNSSASPVSEAEQVPEPPTGGASSAANLGAQPSGDSEKLPPADSSETSVQSDPSAARRLNAEGLRALAGPQPNLAEARSLFQQAVQLDPENVEMLNNLGDVVGRLEDYKTAEAILAKVLAMAPKRRVANGNMGYVEAKLGNIDRAEVYFCEYIHAFDSFDKGEAKLKGSFGDPDPRVQNAVSLTIANCRP